MDARHRAHRGAPSLIASSAMCEWAVDDAGQDVLAGRVDRPRRPRESRRSCRLRDLAVAENDRSVLDRAPGDGDNRGVPNGDHRGWSHLCGETAQATMRRGLSPSSRWGDSRTALTVGLATGSSVLDVVGEGAGVAGVFRIRREDAAGDLNGLAEVVGRVQKFLKPGVAEQLLRDSGAEQCPVGVCLLRSRGQERFVHDGLQPLSHATNLGSDR